MRDGHGEEQSDIDQYPPALVAAYERWVATGSEADFEALMGSVCQHWDGLAFGRSSESVGESLRERFPLAADDYRFRSVVNAFSAEDYEEPEGMQSGAGAVPTRRAGVVKVAGIVLTIFALLAYLVVPVNSPTRTWIQRHIPSRARPIPVSPEHKSVKLRV
jgi:hypothetical protein